MLKTLILDFFSEPLKSLQWIYDHSKKVDAGHLGSYARSAIEEFQPKLDELVEQTTAKLEKIYVKREDVCKAFGVSMETLEAILKEPSDLPGELFKRIQILEQQLGQFKTNFPRVTTSEELVVDACYYLKDKKFNNVLFSKCCMHPTSGWKYFENNWWAQPDNMQAFDRWEIYGPVVVNIPKF